MSRPSATWKAWERFWGLALGGRRVPVTGRTRGDAPDVEHDRYAIEVKYGRVLSSRLRLGMAQARAAAVAHPGRIPLLCITQTVQGQRDNEHYVMLTLADWQLLTGDGACSDE